MCLSKAYLETAGSRELVMEEVASINVLDGKIQLKTLFGEEKEIQATIKQISFLQNSIVLESRG